MSWQMNENEWQELLRSRTTVFGRNSGLFRDAKCEFGTLNLFAIVGAADLVSSRGGRSRIENPRELRLRMRHAQLEHHTNRFPNFNELSEDEQGRILRRSQLIGGIWNMAFGTGSSISMEQYLTDMDTLGLWNVHWQAGAENEQNFEETYPIPEALAEQIAQQRARPPTPAQEGEFCCWHCGRPGHKATMCPSGGSWRRDRRGGMHSRGVHPRCFVCCVYTEHHSENCPYRAAESRLPSDQCWNCLQRLQGRQRTQNKCFNCGEPLRCWNCGGKHRLKDCPQPRRAPEQNSSGGRGEWPPKEPREKRMGA